MTDLATPGPPARSSNPIGLIILVVWLGLGAAMLYLPSPPRVLVFAFVMIGWLLAVMAHEFAHALVAFWGGDCTVRDKGYFEFDPRRYGNLQTTLIIPLLALALGGIGFPGGAVYLRNDLMRGPLWRSAASLAGPAATGAILLVLCSGLSRWSTFGGKGPLFEALAMLAFLQATALILNLLPIPGLDGYNALRPFFPKGLARTLRPIERAATLMLLAVIFLVPHASAVLIALASLLTDALGVRFEAVSAGWDAFHFWR